MPLFIRRRPKAAGKTCSFEPAAFSHMMQCFAIPTLTRFKADSHQGYHFSGFFQRPAQPLPPLERDSGLDFRREVGGQAAPAGHLQTSECICIPNTPLASHTPTERFAAQFVRWFLPNDPPGQMSTETRRCNADPLLQPQLLRRCSPAVQQSEKAPNDLRLLKRFGICPSQLMAFERGEYIVAS